MTQNEELKNLKAVLSDIKRYEQAARLVEFDIIKRHPSLGALMLRRNHSTKK